MGLHYEAVVSPKRGPTSLHTFDTRCRSLWQAAWRLRCHMGAGRLVITASQEEVGVLAGTGSRCRIVLSADAIIARRGVRQLQ